jgi:hypothetical protein
MRCSDPAQPLESDWVVFSHKAGYTEEVISGNVEVC